MNLKYDEIEKQSLKKEKKNQTHSSEPSKPGLISQTHNLLNSRLEFN